MEFTGNEWKLIQKRAFTRWVNSQLKDREMRIYGFEDFRDGVKLCHLMEIISGKSLGRFKNKPKREMHKIENCRTCIQFMKREGLRIVNIDGQDLYNGDEKLIMGLLWMIILRYEINKGASGGAGNAKSKLLAWIRAQIPELDIRNFTTDWNDGVALNALNNALFDGACPGWTQLDPNDGLSNCTLGIDTAERILGVDKLVYPDEMVHPKVDNHAMMAYLAQFMDVVPPSNGAGLCKAWGDGLQFGYANRPMNFGISKPPEAKGDFEVRIEGPDDCSAPVIIEDVGDGEFQVLYNPTIPGGYKVWITLDGENIPGSCFEMSVLPAHMRVYFGSATKTNSKSALKTIEKSLQSGGPVTGLKDWTPIDTEEKKKRNEIMGAKKGRVRAILVVMDGEESTTKFLDSGVTERLIKMGKDLGGKDTLNSSKKKKGTTATTRTTTTTTRTTRSRRHDNQGRSGGKQKKSNNCPKCDNELPAGATNKFCISCGHRLK